MGRTTSTVSAWALPPEGTCACGLSCDMGHDDGEATVARSTPERAPQVKPARVAVSLIDLQDGVFGGQLWVY
jgi:hypothetical protein